jgi:putative phosphoribosyl transferase
MHRGDSQAVKFMTPARFRDRHEAGRQLARALLHYASRPNLLVLALPRGGVPVGYEISRLLNAPLDLMLVRKLGVPGHEELAMGAIASGGIRILSEDIVAAFGVPERVIATVAAHEEQELDRRERIYRDQQPPPMIRGRIIILVDDGLATGSTMRAAAAALRSQDPQRLIVAVPVAPAESCAELGREVDEVCCLVTPSPFFSVGTWYRDFSQTADEEVRSLLEAAATLSRTAIGGQ